MKDDAIKGVKHTTLEVLLQDVTLKPFEHFTPEPVPHDLSVRAFNMNERKTYIIKLYEVVETTSLPKRKKESKHEKDLRKLANDIVDGKLS